MEFQIIKAVLATVVVLSLTSCNGKKVQFVCGISEVSQSGINHVQPVIAAMEKYKEDNGKYPNNIFALIPKYIDRIPIILHSIEGVDETKYKILRHEKIGGGVPLLTEDGRYFKIEFIPTDDRICLMGGRNNICEYTSETKRWACYQH